MQAQNGFQTDELAAIFFTVTQDLTAAFPAEAARQLGWTDVPLITSVEMNVPNAIPRVVRVLALWNTARPLHAIKHVYLGEAARLRPDLAG